MDFGSFLSDVLTTIVGGVVLAFLFFLLREKVLGLMNKRQIVVSIYLTGE